MRPTALLRAHSLLIVTVVQTDEEAVEMIPGPDDPQPLTEEEEQERAALLDGGFKDWSRRDFSAFVRACEKVATFTSEMVSQPQGSTPLEIRGCLICLVLTGFAQLMAGS